MRGVLVNKFSRGLQPSVHGVGIVDAPTKNSDGTRKQAYLTWKDMLRRCYTASSTHNANYADCSVDQSWLRFSVFETWYLKYYRQGYQLDKDILEAGNRVYSPKTCCFVPRAVNVLLTARTKARGPYPQGVTQQVRNGRVVYLVATLHKYGKMHALGWGHDPQALHEIYRKAKAEHIIDVANAQYKAGSIKRNVRDALIRIARDFSFVKDT